MATAVTKTIRTLRTTAGSMLTEIAAAIGTFVGLVWLTANVVLAGVQGTDLSPATAGIPEELVWLGILAVASLGTIWLERDGYRLIRADPHGGGNFAWLSVCYLPCTFLPVGYALSLLLEIPGVFVNLYLVACVLLGGWLAFYGGLDRLDLELSSFVWTFLVVVGMALVVFTAETVLTAVGPLEWLTDTWVLADTTLALFAIAGQGVVLFVGFVSVPRGSVPSVPHR
ncbi:hypothetical protein [Natrialba swarupiae]|uniref:Uncharacterized protein n=1 Tax=Natrialba swarupiae TaxID=2448032 RepID=A0A5D5AM29_9EURY|nr:hypothetical protein [Natrialba swarupiae]TYT61927.1 hypothetical protein FYC77_10645 [Natrialba swarupiae]